MIHIVPATPDIAASLRMRDADRREVMAASGRMPEVALLESVRVSTECWAGMIDDRPIAIFGVGPLNILNGIGSPWMLGSDELVSHSFYLLRMSRPYIERMHRMYPVLFNLVDDRNVVSQRWLRWLGFRLYDPIAYGPFGVKFRPFERVRRV
jgi:hypothetical protein